MTLTQPTDAEITAIGLAADLATRVAGRTSPNPPVGAVVLDSEGRIVGEGATQPAGQAHAEVMALQKAGSRAVGGTLVVTLEPCNHLGRTGPCTEAVIGAGIARVLYAVDDPNPVAAGGAQRLREAGLQVLAGVEEAQVLRGALGPWRHAVTQARPFVTWKFAGTLDGRSAAEDGTSRWVSNPLSRADVHALRDVVDAVLVGSGTVLMDDPQLTVRGVRGMAADELAERQPLRVVMDRRRRVPPEARVFDETAETLVLDTAVPRFALKALFDRGVRHVLLEGGPTLAGAFLEARLVDQVVAYIAPKLLGAGLAVLQDAGIKTISQAVSLDIQDVQRLGDDLKIIATPVAANAVEPAPRKD
ncbi:MAG TPA: bifunctional diaminohydroxyphosphoribosylaminopyrimidine deaminase/5-amino-6-(5-phosphoribosylamino)uracil reductase RibD [Jatrophihabitans sp.]|jgi:diaminohydroxyphosphoribosylaminopyrimidine deaminase/5-amino-6-(5-phosphoribosylamino)uracil reductase|uniref:bifunctional diaminohydroxyphosphoribosylaminopyrimidine deaminase/5-amino-6-(5-phosphoribosylamino)uracil reductase RibD n=1 Tax=Jatrophihabitans sp. TaxID=1932789 RepID=UPI002F25DE3F